MKDQNALERQNAVLSQRNSGFSTELLRKQNAYIKQKHCEIEELRTNDPRKCWDHIKILAQNQRKLFQWKYMTNMGMPMTILKLF